MQTASGTEQVLDRARPIETDDGRARHMLDQSTENLKARAVRGGVARLGGQAAGFIVRFGYLVVLARLLNPDDFGLVAMVTVVTGFYEMFTSAGLSNAMIQQPTITRDQLSKLFWINILVGLLLAALCLATAPVLVRLYNEPRLMWLTVAMAPGFLIVAASVQHMAILSRQLRYITLTAIEIVSLLASVLVGIGMALTGFGYWAIVCASIAAQATSTLCAVVTTRWMPGRFRSSTSVGSMLRFGWTVTLNSLVVYVANNFDKVLLGRTWGADALGLYTRAYQLTNIPTSSLNLAVGGIAFSALSRLQDDPVRLKSYFLKVYTLVVSLTIPVTIFCAVLADDIIMVVLGPKWADAILTFRLMSPTILIFAMINPLSWLLFSVGLHDRSLKIAFVMAPLLIVGYLIGLPYGASGVAAAYSTVMALWLIPCILWSLHETVISPKEILVSVTPPLVAGLVAAGAGFGIEVLTNDVHLLTPLETLLVVGSAMVAIYGLLLLFVFGQVHVYLDLLRSLKNQNM